MYIVTVFHFKLFQISHINKQLKKNYASNIFNISLSNQIVKVQVKYFSSNKRVYDLFLLGHFKESSTVTAKNWFSDPSSVTFQLIWQLMVSSKKVFHLDYTVHTKVEKLKPFS